MSDSLRQRVDQLDSDQRAALFRELLADRSVPKIPRLASSGPSPASFGQRRLWFLHALDGGDAANNLSFAIRLDGHLDVAALRAALDHLVRRHEVLRTSLHPGDDGEPMQVVAGTAAVALDLIELDALDAWHGHALTFAREPFDLAVAPLMRARAYRVGPRQHVLVIVAAHIAVDGWSLGLIARDLTDSYRAIVSGDTLPGPADGGLTYRDFAAWQRDEAFGERAMQRLAHWTGVLADLPMPMDLPTDRPRPPWPTGRGERCPIVIPADLGQRITALARSEGVSAFSVIITTVAATLGRHGGVEEVVLGTAASGRTRAELEGLVGYFGNMMPLRLHLPANRPFAEVLQSAHRVVVDAVDHQDVPFERIVESLSLPRDLSRTPVFQVVVAMQPDAPPTISLPDLAVTVEDFDTGAAAYDINISLSPARGGWNGVVEFRTDLFERSRVERLADHIVGALAAAVTDPSLRVADVVAPTPGDLGIVRLANATAQPTAHRVLDLIRDRVRNDPERVAVTMDRFDGVRQLTYGQLWERATSVAASLAKTSIRCGDTVGIIGARSPELIPGLVGVLLSGAAAVPLDPAQPDARLRDVARVSGARMIIADDDALVRVAGLFDGSGAFAPMVVPLSELTVGQDRAAPPPEPDAGDLAYVLMTSGSTGEPKAVMVQHDGMDNHIAAKVSDLAMDEHDVLAQNGPLSFDVCIWQMLAALTCGGRVVVLPDEVATDPERLLDALTDGITIVQVVPSVLRELLAAEVRRGPASTDLGALRWLVPTGDALPAALCREWFAMHPNVPILNTYGATECSDDQCHLVVEGPADLVGSPATVSIGRPIRCMTAFVLDDEVRHVPVGAVGELHVGGVGVGRGYMGDPRRTAATFIPDPFSSLPGRRLYRTRDQVRQRVDGCFDFIGRTDHLLKVNGYRVEPGEIEAVLDLHPDVNTSAVVAMGTPDRRWLAAFVESTQHGEAFVRQLRRHAAEHLPVAMLPRQFTVMTRLPTNSNGKVDRAALSVVEVAQAEHGPAPLGTDTERAIASAWVAVLGCEVDASTDFFAAGGHSLAATRVVARIEREIGIAVPMRVMFETASLRELAKWVDEADQRELEEILNVVEHLDDDEVARRLGR